MIKDYDYTIEYHPGKANVVADALSRRPESSLSHMRSGYLPLLVDLRALGVILEVEDSEALLADRPKTRCVKYTPMCASARVAPSNIVYQWYGYRSTGTGVLTTKVQLLR